MTLSTTDLTSLVARLWRASRPLTFVGLLMLGLLAAALVGLVADQRTITGAPAWMKPAKFAVSFAIYCLTLAWVFTYLPDWPRTRAAVGWLSAIVFLIEIAIIDLQAWRGTSSHFNTATTLDMVLFFTMGVAIFLQTFTSLAVALALWRQPFSDRALGWALRIGMTMAIVAALTGGLMTTPTAAQMEEVRATGRMPRSGAHTVGAPDGGPGLPVTNWSRDHGDLRVPHFIGLHALQILPLVALMLARPRWPEMTRVRITLAAAASHAALFGLLLWQALRGQPVAAADALAIVALAAWAALTAIALRLAAAVPSHATRRGAQERS
jgi:hypothetical protein